MKIIENNYIEYIFPKKVKCENCDSILELERGDCKCVWNSATLWYDYKYICPCCKKENKFEEPL